MGGLGTFEIVLIFLVILLVFGAKRIPEIARGVGKGIKEFRSATTEIKQELTIDPPPYNRVQPPTQGTAAPRADSPAQQAATPPPAASSSSAESSEA